MIIVVVMNVGGKIYDKRILESQLNLVRELAEGKFRKAIDN